MLAIEEVVAIGLVQTSVNSSTYLRQDHQLHILVLKHDGSISFVGLLGRNPICKWIGIHLAAAALIDPLFKEHRVGICRLRWIGWENNGLFPYSNCSRCASAKLTHRTLRRKRLYLTSKVPDSKPHRLRPIG